MSRVSPRPRARPVTALRRGFALVDAIIGGVILAIGLAAILSLTAHALTMQRSGEIAIRASHLCDELLSLVLMEGPEDFIDMYDTFGRFDEPFDDFDFAVELDDRGEGLPWRVTATVFHRATGEDFSVQTMIAMRGGEEPNPERAPPEPLDRQGRYDELD